MEPKIPAPPAGMAGLPFVPVMFDGLAVTFYVNGQGRMAYSFKATGLHAAPEQGAKPGRGGAKDAV
ncbi:hypothetical protein [Nonomuraea jabiensis]|uniref:hypothetical protein n=1 Tax=Nonomuraea jabiensis TaxID=882448 RepID=UPI0036885790